MLSDPDEETLEAPSDPDEETQEAPLDPEETQKAPPNPEGETREAPSDTGVETKRRTRACKRVDGFRRAGRTRASSGNLPPNSIKAHVKSASARRRERSSTAKISVDVRRRGHDDFSEEAGATGANSEHRSRKSAEGDERAGDGIVEGSLEKEEVQGGSTE